MKIDKKKIIKRFKDKYRLIIYNDNTFKEVGYIRLSAFNLAWISGLVGLLLIVLVFAMVAFTDIRELIPGYPDERMRREMVMNALKLDSLSHEVEIRDTYFANLKAVIEGKPILDTLSKDVPIDSQKMSSIRFNRSKTDSLFRKQIEEEDQYNLTAAIPGSGTSAGTGLSNLHFFKPLNGIITNHFNPDAGHYGTDIVSADNEVIKATLDGTVVLATWTIETGYVIQIQHEAGLMSVYKHNAELLKKMGDKVRGGEVIAFVGNSGELTNGPHLHFEIWYNGKAVNAEDFIFF